MVNKIGNSYLSRPKITSGLERFSPLRNSGSSNHQTPSSKRNTKRFGLEFDYWNLKFPMLRIGVRSCTWVRVWPLHPRCYHRDSTKSFTTFGCRFLSSTASLFAPRGLLQTGVTCYHFIQHLFWLLKLYMLLSKLETILISVSQNKCWKVFGLSSPVL